MPLNAIRINEIESLVESTIDELITDFLMSELTSIEDMDYALEYLKTKINELDVEDFS